MLELIDTEIYENDELKHWGIIGMHWGVRRFQNEDGSLTPEGRERYGVKNASDTKKLTYSKEYEVLKNKKDKTPEEKEKLERLEIGKKIMEKSIADSEKFDEDIKKMPKAVQDQIIECGADYLASTNYGKGMQFCGTMAAIPGAAIGLAATAGLTYAQMKAGLPLIAIAPGIALVATSVGSALGSTAYAGKHINEYQQEYIDTYGKPKYSNNEKALKKYLEDDVNQLKNIYGDDVVAYDQYNGNMARKKGPDYSEKDKEMDAWQKERIKEFLKESYK